MKKDYKWYKQWPVIMAFLLVIMTVAGFVVDQKAGWVISVFLMIYIVVMLILFFHDRTLLISNIGAFGERYGFLHNILLMDMPTPYAVMLDDG